MSLFQPQLQTQQRAAQTQVADNQAELQAISQATDAIVGGVGRVQLDSLQSEFDEIRQARMTGGDRNNLMTQARVALNTFKANSPGLRQNADALFESAFGTGGGGSGGLFAATPTEKGVDKAQQDIAEYAAKNNVSMRVAQQRMAVSGAAEALKAQADIDKYDAEAADKTTELSHQFSLNDTTLRVVDTMNGLLETKGSIDASSVAGFNQSIRMEAMKMEAQIRKNAFRDDGSLAITQSELNRRLQEVKTWQADMNTMVSDFSKSKLSADLLKDISNEGALAFTKAFPLVNAASQISPQLGSQVFDMVTTPDATRRKWISENPKIKSLLENQEAFSANVAEGISKITLVDRQKDSLSPTEGQSVGVALRNGNDEATKYVWDQVASSPLAADKFKQVAYWSPEILEKSLKPGFQYMLNKDYEKYKPVIDSQIAGAVTAFQSNYSLLHSKLPTRVGIVIREDERGNKRLHIETPDGLGAGLEGAENSRNINNMYKLLQTNPKYLRERGEAVGNPDITPEEYLSVILSTTPVTVPSVREVPEATQATPAPTQPQEAGANQPAPFPQQGQIVDGYKYLGGDPSKEENWELSEQSSARQF